MVAITPKTELMAVNLILRNMGETPVNSLVGNLPIEASQAFNTLVEVSEEVQTPGWFFNREFHRLVPNASDEILLPANTLAVQGYGYARGSKLTVRNRKLYDQSPFKNTFKFAGAMELELILGLPFEDLPASARLYITLRAARVMQVRDVGDQMNAQEDSEDERRALALLHAEQLAAEPLSLTLSNTVYDITSGLPRGGWR